jgi:hypothetical protein
MKITTKYNIGDTLFVPLLDSSSHTFIANTSGKAVGVYIKKTTISHIQVDPSVQYVFISGEVRDERFVFQNYKDAQKYACEMVDILAQNNKKIILEANPPSEQ